MKNVAYKIACNVKTAIVLKEVTGLLYVDSNSNRVFAANEGYFKEGGDSQIVSPTPDATEKRWVISDYATGAQITSATKLAVAQREACEKFESANTWRNAIKTAELVLIKHGIATPINKLPKDKIVELPIV